MTMPDKRDWSPEEDARLRALWIAGHSSAAIGRMMNRSKSSVVGRAHRQGLPRRESPILANPNQLTAAQDGTVRRLVAQGFTRRHIAKHLNVGVDQVSRAAQRLGLPGYGGAPRVQARGHGVRTLTGAGGAAQVARLRSQSDAARAAPGASQIPAKAGDPPPGGHPGHVTGVSSPNLPPAAVTRPAVLSGGDARGCRWPLWSDTGRPTHEYCGARVRQRRDGSACVYCAEHATRAFTRRFEDPEEPRVITRPTFAWGGRAA